MAHVNQVFLLGNLGADPDLKYLASGTAVCELRLATNESSVKDGARQERTEWHRIIVWDKLAVNCAANLKKGRLIHVQGRVQTRSWEVDGEKKYMTEIVAYSIQFLGGGKGAEDKEPEHDDEPVSNIKRPPARDIGNPDNKPWRDPARRTVKKADPARPPANDPRLK